MKTNRSDSAPKTEIRRLHLLDLDNLIGGPSYFERVKPVLAAYRRTVDIGPWDHVVIAAERTLATLVAFGLPRAARLIVAVGESGADRRLVGDYPAHFVADRYDALIIGSGDRIFAPLAAELGALGTPVTVVASPRATSAKLRLASRSFIPLSRVDRKAA